MRILRKRAPSPALVVAVVALVVALGGTSYAAFGVPNNSVGTKQLQNKAVTNDKLAPLSVGTAKIRDGAVTGSKMNFNGVQVPSAGFANYANSAGYAYGLYGTQYVVSAAVANPASTQTPGFVACPTGTSVLGGGAFGAGGVLQSVNSSYPFRTSGSQYPNGWFVYMNNYGTTASSFNAYAICERIANSTTAFSAHTK